MTPRRGTRRDFTPEQTDDLTEASGAATHADLATKADLKSELGEGKSSVSER